MDKIKIDDIKISGYNPRKMKKSDMEKLKRSIKEFGFVEPIVVNNNVNRKNILIGGHQRIIAAKALGLKKVPVVFVDLPENKEKLLNLALNKITGEWDEDKLTVILNELSKSDADLILSGFSDLEIDSLLGELAGPEEKEFDIGKALEEPKYKIKKGDVWLLGRNRLMCGDSTNKEDLKKLLDKQKIDLIITSPPYNVGITYSKYKDDKPFIEYMTMIRQVFENIKNNLNKNRYLCINIGDQCKINLSAHYSVMLEKLGFKYSRTIYWYKPLGAANPTITLRNPYPRWFMPKVNTETILIYSDEFEQTPEKYNVMIVYSEGILDRKSRPEREELKEIPKEYLTKYISNVWSMQPETIQFKKHPTPFPVLLPKNCILFYSLENENIFDPFGGIGTTIIAAEQTNRIGFVMDIDPVDIVLLQLKDGRIIQTKKR